MKKTFLLILTALVLVGCAHAEYWDDDEWRPVVCCDNRPGCQVLQAVMMGSFVRFDPEDSLNTRVLSAALPRLAAVTEDDFTHFSESFDVDAQEVRELYHIALCNCLRSDIIITPLSENMDQQNARTVLGLFMDPVGEDAEAQMRAIRENSDAETVRMLARHAEVPVGFVEYLMNAEAEESSN